jgi:4'-phosphopantetheinyl transferase EntD
VELAAALAALVPHGVRTGARAVAGDEDAPLHPAEASAVAAARAARRREFATGRALLRELLGSSEALPPTDRRAPAWPAGWCGSLAHDGDVAVAAVAPSPPWRALGVDLEAHGGLDADEAAIVLRPDEAIEAVDPVLAFVLKETAYKAWSALGGGLLDHHDVRVTMCDGDRFEATVVAAGVSMAGRYASVAGRWLAFTAGPTVELPIPGTARAG